QRAEVSSPPSTVRGSTESANTPCPADGVANAPSTAPIISIADANARMLSRSFALPLQRSYRTLAAVSSGRAGNRLEIRAEQIVPLIGSTNGPRTSRKSTHFQRGHRDTPRSGRGGRRFKSCHSDQRNPGNIGISYNCPKRFRFSGTVIGTETP